MLLQPHLVQLIYVFIYTDLDTSVFYMHEHVYRQNNAQYLSSAFRSKKIAFKIQLNNRILTPCWVIKLLLSYEAIICLVSARVNSVKRLVFYYNI